MSNNYGGSLAVSRLRATTEVIDFTQKTVCKALLSANFLSFKKTNDFSILFLKAYLFFVGLLINFADKVYHISIENNNEENKSDCHG